MGHGLSSILYGWHLWVSYLALFFVVVFWISILQLMAAIKSCTTIKFGGEGNATAERMLQCKTWTPSTSEHRTFLSWYEGGGPQPRRFMEIRCLRKISIWGFPKMVVPNNHGFPTKNGHFGVFWGYHHLRKHPYIWNQGDEVRRVLFGFLLKSSTYFLRLLVC